MAETPLSRFRLGPTTLAALDALAASNGGVRTTAVKEAVAYWRAAVEHAARENAAALTPEEWGRLAALNDPDPWPAGAEPDDAPDRVLYWSARLARELEDVYDGRAVVLPEHERGRAANRRLAEKIRPWDLARGYALFACLRHFWRSPEAGGGEWWHPEAWMAPTAGREDGGT